MMFHNYLKDIPICGFRKALIELFRMLDTKAKNRDKYLAKRNPHIAIFPYVNGRLFTDKATEFDTKAGNH